MLSVFSVPHWHAFDLICLNLFPFWISGVSAEIYTRYGYEAIYGSACGFHILAITYALLFVKNTQQIKEELGLIDNSSINSNKSDSESLKSRKDSKTNIGSIFSLDHVIESFGVAFRRRPGGVRHVVIILISLFGLYSFANNGISSINNQYARAKFVWEDGTDSFNLYMAKVQSIGTVFNLFAIGVMMPVMTQILKLRDLSITAFCVFSSITGITTILFAHKAELLYLANFFRMFSDVVTVGIRSVLTKIVGEKDVGKVNYHIVFLLQIASILWIQSNL